MARWEDPAGVEREFARALELDPNSATTILLRGFCSFLDGRFDEANRDLDRAEQLDPLSPIGPVMREIGAYSAGRFRAVIEAHKKTVAIDPTFVYFQSWVGAAYRELGDYPAALREFAIADKTLGGLPQHGLALTYLRMGRVDDARAIMRRMDERAKTHYVPFFTRAGLHAALGDMDTAVSLLQLSVDHRESVMLMIRSVSELAPLLKDPRAKRIFDQVDALRSGK
jgi:tetratricopeptide (TPR) repeat protein